jgi:hypothetical protein
MKFKLETKERILEKMTYPLLLRHRRVKRARILTRSPRASLWRTLTRHGNLNSLKSPTKESK